MPPPLYDDVDSIADLDVFGRAIEISLDDVERRRLQVAHSRRNGGRHSARREDEPDDGERRPHDA